MNALTHLASLLRGAMSEGSLLPVARVGELDAAIEQLRRQVKEGGGTRLPADAQRAAVERFRQAPAAVSLRDARLVSFSMDMQFGDGGSRLLGDANHTLTLLKAVDTWREEPRRFRRCYQGLVRSYFSFDGQAPDESPAARENWERLRVFLTERLPRIVAGPLPGEPDWVQAAIANPLVFSRAPTEPYAAGLLRGDSAVVERLCTRLGIAPSSWFMRDLLMAQIREATKLADAGFIAVLDRMLEVLGRNAVLRDRGVALLLDRYTQLRPPQGETLAFHRGLHNAAVLCWGNPWLPQDESRWARVSDESRALAGRWLKLELIDSYFAEFAEDGAKDPRRATFWKRFAFGIDELRVVLPAALSGGQAGSASGDSALLHRKLSGVVLTMREPGADTALLMTIGHVVIAEFGRLAHGMYGYSERNALPFDTRQPLAVADPAPNTLRHPSRSLWLQHKDGVRGWATWELMFEALLKRQYGIEPGGRGSSLRARHVDLSIAGASADISVEAARDEAGRLLGQAAQTGLSAHWQTAEAGSVAFGRAELAIFARVHSLTVQDELAGGGKLWVRTDASEDGVSWVLRRWGFAYSEGEGWFKA